VWHPINPDEYEFHNSAEFVPFTTPGQTGGAGFWYNYSLGFIAIAPATTPQTYEYEAVVIFEAKGLLVHGQLPTEADSPGLSWVQNLVKDTAARKPKKDRARWVKTLLDVGYKAGTAYLTGGPIGAAVSLGNSAITALYSE
jgi:hypothetical protein